MLPKPHPNRPLHYASKLIINRRRSSLRSGHIDVIPKHNATKAGPNKNPGVDAARSRLWNRTSRGPIAIVVVGVVVGMRETA